MSVVQDKQKTPFTLIIVFVLVLSFLLTAGGELFASHCADDESDCPNHCDSSCNTCGDCTNCLPTVHMIPGLRAATDFVFHESSWAVPTTTGLVESAYAGGIDHPPQNLS